MDFNEYIDRLSDELRAIAREHGDMHAFEMDDRMERLIAEYAGVMGDRGHDRAWCYRKFEWGSHLAFAWEHPESEIWKVFFLDGEPVGGYTLEGEFAGEEESTLRLIAHDHGCDVADIDVDYEQREVAA